METKKRIAMRLPSRSHGCSVGRTGCPRSCRVLRLLQAFHDFFLLGQRLTGLSRLGGRCRRGCACNFSTASGDSAQQRDN